MVVWIPLVLAAAQGLNSGLAKDAAYRAQKRAQNRFDRQNREFTNADLIAGYGALTMHRLQQRRQFADTLDQLTRQSGQRIATASVSAAQSGVKGNTVDAVLNDFKRIQLESEQNILDTEEYAQAQYTQEVESMRSQAHSRLVAGQMGQIQRPNYMQEFVNFTTAALQAFDYERQFKNKYPTEGLGGGYGSGPYGAHGQPPSQIVSLPGPSAPVIPY